MKELRAIGNGGRIRDRRRIERGGVTMLRSVREGDWERWIQRSGLGDERALEELHGSSRWMLSAVAVAILNDPAEAEEVVVDVLLQVWQQAARFDASRGSARAWLKTMARSRAIDRLRRRSRRAFETDLDAVLDRPGTADENPETALAGLQRTSDVRAALAKLSGEQRRAIELAFLAGLSHAEVARALDAPLGTVKSRIRAGLEKLKHLLREAA